MVEYFGVPLPHVSSIQAVVMEGLLTFFFIVVIIGAAVGGKIVGNNAADSSRRDSESLPNSWR